MAEGHKQIVPRDGNRREELYRCRLAVILRDGIQLAGNLRDVIKEARFGIEMLAHLPLERIQERLVRGVGDGPQARVRWWLPTSALHLGGKGLIGRRTFRQQLTLEKERKVWGSGRCVEQKRFHTLVRVVSKQLHELGQEKRHVVRIA